MPLQALNGEQQWQELWQSTSCCRHPGAALHTAKSPRGTSSQAGAGAIWGLGKAALQGGQHTSLHPEEPSHLAPPAHPAVGITRSLGLSNEGPDSLGICLGMSREQCLDSWRKTGNNMTPLILCKGSHAWTSACAAHPTHLAPGDVLAPTIQMSSGLPSDREDITVMWDGPIIPFTTCCQAQGL